MDNLQAKNRIEVIDREGWRKEYLITKAILHIGSDSRNDIVLDGGRSSGIEPRHAQLIVPPGGHGYRLVNLGQSPILLAGEGRILPQRGAMDLRDGDTIRIGDHTFRFFATQGASSSIGLSFRLSDTQLTVDAVLDGLITVQNLGNTPGVQFKLTLEGLSPAWYELGPGPILFPGAQKEVPMRIRHAQEWSVPAGPRTVVIRAMATSAYPGENASMSRVIQIAPFYRHALRLIPV